MISCIENKEMGNSVFESAQLAGLWVIAIFVDSLSVLLVSSLVPIPPCMPGLTPRLYLQSTPLAALWGLGRFRSLHRYSPPLPVCPSSLLDEIS